MAIVDDDQNDSGSNSRFAELKTIDINDTSLPEGKEVEINPDADAWENPQPPPDGIYKFKLFGARNAFQMGKTEDGGDVYYQVNLECKLISENKDLDGRTIFGKVNTLIGQGKEISTMAGLIRKMGPTVPSKITPKQLLQLFKRVLSKEPSLYAEGEWAAWDMKKGEWIKRGMKHFPKVEGKNGFHHVVRDSQGNNISAKWKIVKWWGIKEYKEMMEKEEARKRQSQGRSATQSQATIAPKSEEVHGGGEFAEMKTNSMAAGASGSSQSNVNVEDGDFVIDD